MRKLISGGNSGNSVGSIQGDVMQGHEHSISDPQNGTPRTSSETRPLNVYLNHIIAI